MLFTLLVGLFTLAVSAQPNQPIAPGVCLQQGKATATATGVHSFAGQAPTPFTIPATSAVLPPFTSACAASAVCKAVTETIVQSSTSTGIATTLFAGQTFSEVVTSTVTQTIGTCSVLGSVPRARGKRAERARREILATPAPVA